MGKYGTQSVVVAAFGSLLQLVAGSGLGGDAAEGATIAAGFFDDMEYASFVHNFRHREVGEKRRRGLQSTTQQLPNMLQVVDGCCHVVRV